MCLAIPGKIIEINNTLPELKMAKVDFGGIVNDICIQWVEASIGDYILAHAGMAISVVDALEAEKTLSCFDSIIDSLEVKEDEIYK